jgi:hypothetical protein
LPAPARRRRRDPVADHRDDVARVLPPLDDVDLVFVLGVIGRG